MKVTNVYFVSQNVGRTKTHSDWDTFLYEQGRYRTSVHPSEIGCSRDEENDEDEFDGHVCDI